MKDRQIKLISPLENFECVRQKIELSENLRIREVLNTERKLIPDTGKPISHLMPLHGLPETLKYCLETCYQRRTDVVDPYRKVAFNNPKFRVHKAPLRKEVELRIAPNLKTGIAEVRIWYKDTLTDVYQVKNSDLNLVHF